MDLEKKTTRPAGMPISALVYLSNNYQPENLDSKNPLVSIFDTAINHPNPVEKLGASKLFNLAMAAIYNAACEDEAVFSDDSIIIPFIPQIDRQITGNYQEIEYNQEQIEWLIKYAESKKFSHGEQEWTLLDILDEMVLKRKENLQNLYDLGKQLGKVSETEYMPTTQTKEYKRIFQVFYENYKVKVSPKNPNNYLYIYKVCKSFQKGVDLTNEQIILALYHQLFLLCDKYFKEQSFENFDELTNFYLKHYNIFISLQNEEIKPLKKEGYSERQEQFSGDVEAPRRAVLESDELFETAVKTIKSLINKFLRGKTWTEITDIFRETVLIDKLVNKEPDLNKESTDLRNIKIFNVGQKIGQNLSRLIAEIGKKEADRPWEGLILEIETSVKYSGYSHTVIKIKISGTTYEFQFNDSQTLKNKKQETAEYEIRKELLKKFRDILPPQFGDKISVEDMEDYLLTGQLILSTNTSFEIDDKNLEQLRTEYIQSLIRSNEIYGESSLLRTEEGADVFIKSLRKGLGEYGNMIDDQNVVKISINDFSKLNLQTSAS